MGYHGTGVNYGGRELDELRNPVVRGQGSYALGQAQRDWEAVSKRLRQVGMYVESSMNKNSAAQEGAAADATQAQGLSPLAAYAQAAQIQAEFAAEATGNQAQYYEAARNGMPEHMDRPSLWPDILTPWEYFRKKREYERRVDRATDQMYTYQSNSNSNISSMPVFTQPATTNIGTSVPQGTQVHPGGPTTTTPTLPAGTPTAPAGAGGLPGGSLGPVATNPGVPGGGIRGPGIPVTSPVGGLPGTGGIPGVPGLPGTGTGGVRPGLPGTGTAPGTGRPGTGGTRPGTGGVRPAVPGGSGTARPGTGTGTGRPGGGAIPGEGQPGAGRSATGRPGTGRAGVPGGRTGVPGEYGRPGAGRPGTSRLMPGNLGSGIGEEALRSGRGSLGEGPFGRGAGQGPVGRGTGAVGEGPLGRGAAGEPGGRTGVRGGGGAGGFGPMGAGSDGEDDLEHRTPDYLVGEDIFRDGSMVAPPVIGEDMPDYYHR